MSSTSTTPAPTVAILTAALDSAITTYKTDEGTQQANINADASNQAALIAAQNAAGVSAAALTAGDAALLADALAIQLAANALVAFLTPATPPTAAV